MQDYVSVIIPTFNRESFVTKAVDSVLEQTHKKFELIVVDDGSTDNTREILSPYEGKITYISTPNKGPAAARNTGIRAARYDLISFLDSDDWFDERKLAIQVNAMVQSDSVFLSHTQEVWFRNGRLLNQMKKHKKSTGYIFPRCLELCAVGMSTVMARKEIFNRIGFFDESYPCCEDYDLWLRASIEHNFLLVDQSLTYKRGGRQDQVSSQYRVGMDKYRIQSILKILHSSLLNGEQEMLARKELVRKCLIYGNGCIKHGRMEEGEYFLRIAQEYGSTCSA